MKNLLGLIAFALILMASPASAGGWYAGGYGGANWDDVISLKGVDAQTGTVIGGVVGTQVSAVPGMRVEVDVSYRQNDVEVKFGPGIDVSHETIGVLGNFIYDVPVKLGPVQPYVLAGVGVASTEATFENVSLLKLEATGLAWQLGAGLNTRLADNIVFGLGYRYFNGPELEVLGTELSDGTNHSVVAELKFAFN